jgi:hypothetical protein
MGSWSRFPIFDNRPDESGVGTDEQIGHHSIGDAAARFHQERSTPHAEAERAVHPVGADDPFFGIGQEWKLEIVGIRKPAMAGRGLRADAQNADVERSE